MCWPTALRVHLLRCCPDVVVFNLPLHTQCLSAARVIQSSPWGLMYGAWPVFIRFPELSSLLPSVVAQRHFCQAVLDSPQNPSTFRKGLGSLSSQFPYPFALCSGIWFDWLQSPFFPPPLSLLFAKLICLLRSLPCKAKKVYCKSCKLSL